MKHPIRIKLTYTALWDYLPRNNDSNLYALNLIKKKSVDNF